MPFIKVTDSTNLEVYINVDQIVTVEKDGPHSRIDLAGDSTRDKHVLAKASPEEIMERISAVVKAGA